LTYKHTEKQKEKARDVLMQEPHRTALRKIIERDGQLTEENIAKYIRDFVAKKERLNFE